MYFLEVENLTKIYGRKQNAVTAVDQISFNLKQGEILGFLGPNGSGKTTAIQMLLGVLTPTSGKISYFSRDFKKHKSEILNEISFASTYTSLPFVLTIEENLKVFARLYKIKDIFEICDPLLKRFGIIAKKKSLISSLSAGQITRLMLVKAFCTKPKVVLLDEPTASLDPDVASDVCNFLLEQRKNHNISLLFTSHKMDEVSKICDRVIFLRNGKVIADDLPRNLAQKASLHQIQLTITDKIEKAIRIAQHKNLSYNLKNKTLELSLNENEIPLFLEKLVKENIIYTSIKIKEPLLEDFFLKTTQSP